MKFRRLIASPEAQDRASCRLKPTSGKTPLMSALGHKQTYAVQKAMSALPRIATARADFRKRSCLLYPQKRTCAVQNRMSAKGQKRTPAQSLWLFDHLVRPREECRRHGKAERLGRFEIDHQLIFRRRLYRQVDRLFALENAVDVRRRAPGLVEE